MLLLNSPSPRPFPYTTSLVQTESFAFLQGAAEVQFSIKPGGHRSHPLGQSSESCLKVILKETAERCDVEALVEVLEHT